MTEKFIVSKWFKSRANLNIQTFEIEGIEFELMALNEVLKESVELCDTYEEMLSLAADSGISYDRKRVVDDVELAKDIELLWGLGDLDVEADPCIKYQVGEKVCEISGLLDLLESTLEAAKEADNIIDGDNLPESDITLGQLNDDANQASSVAAA